MTENKRHLHAALIFAALVKLALFVFLAVSPLESASVGTISPLVEQTATDMHYYQDGANLYFRSDASFVDYVAANFSTVAGWRSASVMPPALPFLLFITDYRAGNTLPLALVYLAFAIAWTSAWLAWMARRGVGLGWLLLFGLLPSPLWFMVNISTDLLFALVFTGFYLAYFRESGHRKIAAWLVALLLLILCRTNGLAVLAFVGLDILLARDIDRRHKQLIVALLCLSAPVVLLYLPSYLGTGRTLLRLEYFGATQADYLAGRFPALPAVIDLPLSALALFAAKVLYSVGLRPSFTGTAPVLVAVRALPGLILLPGLIWLLWRAPKRERYMVLLFLLPIVTGPAQDRYLLPLQGLLFYYGALAYGDAWKRLAGALFGRGRRP
jgi:hypothetical protein